MPVDHDQYFHYLQQVSPLGRLYREHVMFPKVRRRLLGLTLDLGCGIGDMLASRPQTIGVDVNPQTVAYCCSRGLKAVLMQPDVLPFGDQQFDSVLMDNVLEHIAQPQALLIEVSRVLKPGGRLVVGVPGRKGWDADADHKVFYDEVGLRDCIVHYGFRNIEFFYVPGFKSDWLSRAMRQYFVYGLFCKNAE